jgi:circadian clock protein KaiC
MSENKIVAPKKIPAGISGLDFILNGGLPQNRLYLVQGDPGTGKTTLGIQFLLEGLRQGESALYVTLSESEEELRASAASHGWSLDGIDIVDLTISGEVLGSGDNNYTVFHPSEVELDETTRTVLDQVERIKPRRLVFDSLSEMRMLASDALRFRRQILALKQYFINKECTVMLLDDKTSEFSDRQLESIAHGVINLKYVPPEYGKQRHTLQVTKMRSVNFQSGAHDFNIETGGIVVFPRLSYTGEHHKLTSEQLLSGDENMDELLGGLSYGTSTILMGPAGVGKSTLSLIYVNAAAHRGERSAIYLFDESIETLYKRTESLGLHIKVHVEAGLIVLRQIKLAELTPGELAHLISEEVEQNNIRIVVIDSVNGYLMATPKEKFLTMQFHELLGYLNHRGIITILVVGQYGMIGPMQSPIDLSYLADTVVLLRYFEAEGEVRQAISVLKKRTGKHERSIREYKIDQGGLILGRPLTEFRGVLTGVPTYHGKDDNLMRKSDDKQ